MSTAHLICGLPCSGKTTYAHGVHADLDSVLFSLDRWLITVFGRYSLATVGHEEHTRRVSACRDLTWGQSAELLRRSVDVILDDGFFLRENHIRCIEAARAVGAGRCDAGRHAAQHRPTPHVTEAAPPPAGR